MTDEAREPVAGPQCPTCARPVSWSGNPARPFCSLTCRLIDLGHWLDGLGRGSVSLPDSSSPLEPAADE